MKELLIKTFKAEDLKYAKALLEQGEVYFQHVNNFREVINDCQRNDLIEGQTLENFSPNIAPSIKRIYLGNKHVINWISVIKNHPELKNKQINFRLTYIVDWLIYCMTYVNSSMKNYQNIYETVNKLGDYSVVITDSISFVDKIGKQVGISRQGCVNYTDDVIKNPFMKRKEFEGQSEYRIAIDAHGLKSKTIHIGSVEGFICSSKNIDIIKLYL